MQNNQLLIKLLKKNGRITLTANGDSMMPFFRDGDKIEVKKTAYGNLRVGDVVLIEKSAQLVIHRLIYKCSDYAVAKGDHNILSDGKIAPIEVLGKAIKVIRKQVSYTPESLYLLQSSVYYQELEKLIDIFNKEKIDYLILKGLPLYIALEGRIPNRLYSDCDILVGTKCMQKAYSILQNAGFENINTSYSRTHERLKNIETEVAFQKMVKGVNVALDIHYEPAFLLHQIGSMDYLYPDALRNKINDEFLSRKKKLKFAHTSFYALEPIDLLIYLCLHFFHHNFRRIYALEFISAVVKKYFNNKDKWGVFEKRMGEYKVRNFIYPVIVMLDKYFPQKGIDGVINPLQPRNTLLRKYLNEGYFEKDNVFDGQRRIPAGIERFINIFLLSEESWVRKALAIFHPSVIYSLLWSLYMLGRKRVGK